MFKDKASVDEIYHRLDRRWNASSPILRYAHRRKFEKLLQFINSGDSVLDMGRGGSVDGVLGVLAAQVGAHSTITNVSENHLESIKRFARAMGVEDKIDFKICSPQTGDLFDDNVADVVVSLHVLEHLEDFDQGIDTLHRLTRDRVIVALPTCLNVCVWIRFGGQSCYHFSVKSFLALFSGMGQVVDAFLKGKEGVTEDLTEDSGNQCRHLWRFPWAMKNSLNRHGFQITKFGPDTLCLPWFSMLQPVTEWLDRIGYMPVINIFGYGSHALISKNTVKL